MSMSQKIALHAKIRRLAAMSGKSFAFRLSAILVSDSRPGQVWGA